MPVVVHVEPVPEIVTAPFEPGSLPTMPVESMTVAAKVICREPEPASPTVREPLVVQREPVPEIVTEPLEPGLTAISPVALETAALPVMFREPVPLEPM